MNTALLYVCEKKTWPKDKKFGAGCMNIIEYDSVRCAGRYRQSDRVLYTGELLEPFIRAKISRGLNKSRTQPFIRQFY